MKGPVNSSPGALPAPAAWCTVSTGGCIAGCERKLLMSAGVPGVEGNSLSAITAGVAIVKLSLSLRALPLREGFQRALTVTRSPAAKGLLGRKLAPVADA